MSRGNAVGDSHTPSLPSYVFLYFTPYILLPLDLSAHILYGTMQS